MEQGRQETRTETQGKLPKTQKIQRNSGTMPRPKGFLRNALAPTLPLEIAADFPGWKNHFLPHNSFRCIVNRMQPDLACNNHAVNNFTRERGFIACRRPGLTLWNVQTCFYVAALALRKLFHLNGFLPRFIEAQCETNALRLSPGAIHMFQLLQECPAYTRRNKIEVYRLEPETKCLAVAPVMAHEARSEAIRRAGTDPSGYKTKTGHLKAVWLDLLGCVFEVWPGPGAWESLPKCRGRRPPHLLEGFPESPGSARPQKCTNRIRPDCFGYPAQK
jgi:hypothetical protein